MARTSHDEVMEKLRDTPVWQAISNDDMELVKRLIAKEEDKRQ